jgi:hypothetical protein
VSTVPTKKPVEPHVRLVLLLMFGIAFPAFFIAALKVGADPRIVGIIAMGFAIVSCVIAGRLFITSVRPRDRG